MSGSSKYRNESETISTITSAKILRHCLHLFPLSVDCEVKPAKAQRRRIQAKGRLPVYSSDMKNRSNSIIWRGQRRMLPLGSVHLTSVSQHTLLSSGKHFRSPNGITNAISRTGLVRSTFGLWETAFLTWRFFATRILTSKTFISSGFLNRFEIHHLAPNVDRTVPPAEPGGGHTIRRCPIWPQIPLYQCIMTTRHMDTRHIIILASGSWRKQRHVRWWPCALPIFCASQTAHSP